MRKFKFRAWDKLEKQMLYENDVDGTKEWPSLLAVGFHGLPICVDKDSFKDHVIVGWNRDHNLILMQYTGLEDKNGKEIYEGDILSNGQHIDWIVVYDEASFKVKHEGLNLEKYVLNSGAALSREITGNIYENPELITKD